MTSVQTPPHILLDVDVPRCLPPLLLIVRTSPLRASALRRLADLLGGISPLCVSFPRSSAKVRSCFLFWHFRCQTPPFPASIFLLVFAKPPAGTRLKAFPFDPSFPDLFAKLAPTSKSVDFFLTIRRSVCALFRSRTTPSMTGSTLSTPLLARDDGPLNGAATPSCGMIVLLRCVDSLTLSFPSVDFFFRPDPT